MKSLKLILLSLVITLSPISAQDLKVPSFEEVLSLKRVGSVAISPDGNNIVYSVNQTDWKENRYDSELWMATKQGEVFPLTRTEKGNSSGAVWSPDSKWILFRADRDGSTQLWAIRAAGGEAIKVTQVDGNIGSYDWSPDGQKIAFTLSPKSASQGEDRKDRFGAYDVDDEEYQLAGLYSQPFFPYPPDPSELPCYEKNDSLRKINCIQYPVPDTLVHSDSFTVTSFLWSPDGKSIAFNKQPDPLINSFFASDIALVELSSGKMRDLVSNPSVDRALAWSPDGASILFTSGVDNLESIYYANNRLFILSVEESSSREVGQDFDEDIGVVDWNPAGIFFTAWQKTARRLFRLDPESGGTSIVLDDPERIGSVSFSKDGKAMAFTAEDGSHIREVYRTVYPVNDISLVTSYNDQIEGWKTSDSQMISWKSEDGTEIEGVLHKPKDYDPDKKYPLLVIIHGGPTGISTTKPLESYVYPIVQWLDKGALILEPNYRGSAGYGADFRKLNVRNLGVGDAWDVLSGVEHLVDQGLVDPDRMGCMGWSQGGYISAFLTTTSKKFKAISVGAGISNWMTYYVNTDIHPFTRQYLKATPWEDEEIYAKTSPMTYVNQASTPTLIQHGEFDRRVPIPNAFELAQGLRDRGVPAKLVVYKGFGHGITKPKERLAAVWHNWQWFGKYIWDEEIPLPFEQE